MDAPAITEAATLRPLTPYGATKAAGEMLMSAYTASYGVRCACLRLTNVYGSGMQAKDSIVARLMRAIRSGGTFEIYGDGRQVRDYVNVGRHRRRRCGWRCSSEEWKGPVVIGTGTLAVGARGSRGGAPGHRSRARRSATARPRPARCPP